MYEERRIEHAWDMRGRKELDTLTLSDPTPNHFSAAVSVCADFSLPRSFQGAVALLLLFFPGIPITAGLFQAICCTVLGEADVHRRIL